MIKRLRPWQAAAALTVVLFAAQVVLLRRPGSSSPDAETPAAISPLPSEIIWAAAFGVLCFAVLWAVFSLAARSRARRGSAPR